MSSTDVRAALPPSAQFSVEFLRGYMEGEPAEVRQHLERLVAALSASPQGRAEPAAYVPVHPRLGPLWSDTFCSATDTSESRAGSYPRMALYAAPPPQVAREAPCDSSAPPTPR